MYPVALWVVGEPGAGKSELCRKILGPWRARIEGSPEVFGKWTQGDGWIAPGTFTGETFDGADRVGYSQVGPYLQELDPQSVFWLHVPKPKGVLFDGSRFAVEPAVKWAETRGFKLRCLYLTTDSLVCQARRDNRDWHPNASWLKGAATKAYKFAHMIRDRGGSMLTFNSDSYDKPSRIVADLRNFCL